MLDTDLQRRFLVIAGGKKGRRVRRQQWLLAAAGILVLAITAAAAYLSDPAAYRMPAHQASEPTSGGAGVP